MLDQLQFTLECRVEMVLYVVVCAPRKHLGDLRPLVTVLVVKLNDFLIFFFCPFVLFNVWVQVVVPSLSTLLSDPAGKSVRNLTPVLSSVSLYHLHELFILFLSPRPFDHLWVEYLLPPM